MHVPCGKGTPGPLPTSSLSYYYQESGDSNQTWNYCPSYLLWASEPKRTPDLWTSSSPPMSTVLLKGLLA